MEKITYCRFCNEKHVVSETLDGDGAIVGLFCNREKALITAFTTKWNGEDISTQIRRFVDFSADKRVLKSMKGDKLRGLARKFAYQFLQTSFARERRINYAFAVHITLDELFSLRGKLFTATVEEI